MKQFSKQKQKQLCLKAVMWLSPLPFVWFHKHIYDIAVIRRRQARKELHKAQIADAKRCGVPADSVPPVVLPSHEELDSDLRKLTEEQEKTLAEMQKVLRLV